MQTSCISGTSLIRTETGVLGVTARRLEIETGGGLHKHKPSHVQIEKVEQGEGGKASEVIKKHLLKVAWFEVCAAEIAKHLQNILS